MRAKPPGSTTHLPFASRAANTRSVKGRLNHALIDFNKIVVENAVVLFFHNFVRCIGTDRRCVRS